MKLIHTLLFLFMLHSSFGQEDFFDKINTSYEAVLARITAKDTLIKNITKYYKCGEDLSGRIEYYYDNDQLRLITHIYNQGFGNDTFLENYFVEKDTLRLKTVLSEEVYLNTKNTESSQGISTFSGEKVIKVIEQRMFFNGSLMNGCIGREHWAKYSEWDQEYFDKLRFAEADCLDDIEDIRYKYRILRKAETKLVNYGNRERKCIFHIW